jgi:hypothetical protein
MLLYTLPNARVIILIIPLVLLYRDILRRAREIKIDYLE